MTDSLNYGQHETVDLGVHGTNPAAVNDPTARVPLGAMYRQDGAVYRYVKHKAGTHAVATANGYPAYWKTLAPASGTFEVTADESDTLAGINAVAGVYGAVITADYYTFVQVGGVVDAYLSSGAVAGDMAIGYTTDGAFDHVNAGTAPVSVVFGVVLGSVSLTTGLTRVLLQNLMW